MVSIYVLSLPEVGDCVRPGHRGGAFIKAAGKRSFVGVLVERTSRLLLARMQDAMLRHWLA
jgi:IS30 family transposase